MPLNCKGININFSKHSDEKSRFTFIYNALKIRPFVNSEIPCKIYKQTILPSLDYVEFMIESGPVSRVNRLENIQLKALKYIDNRAHKGQGDDILYSIYNVQP